MNLFSKFMDGMLAVLVENSQEAHDFLSWCHERDIVWLSGNYCVGSKVSRDLLAGKFGFPRYFVSERGRVRTTTTHPERLHIDGCTIDEFLYGNSSFEEDAVSLRSNLFSVLSP